MRINSSGDVGIGTTTVDRKLHVKSAGLIAKLESTTDNSLIMFATPTNETAGTIPNIGANDNDLAFTTGNLERMRIDSSGVMQMAVGSSALFQRNTGGTNSTAILFNSAGSQVGKVFFNNTDTFYSTGSSDRTLKKNFENWTETILTSFKNLNPQKFNFLQEENTDAKHKGFIAQDLADQFPEAYPIDPETNKYGFNPSGMVVYLMKAIQELEAKVAALEAA